SSPQECLQYWRDSVACLRKEGAKRPKMMTVGLHGRIIGRPGRIAALEAFLDTLLELDDVWICKRGEIARHWIAQHPSGR
ncbi:MAG: allantoinase, partial [Kiloniellales bacterium]|nr:allantoinase [Kiloniellales bacterium]